MINGDGYVDRKEILTAIKEEAAIGESCIEYFYRMERGREFFIVFATELVANHCAAIGVLKLNENNECRLERIDKQKLSIKVHWLPPYINDDYVFGVFDDYGEVISIEKDIDHELNIPTCVRRVKLIVREDMISKIPHLHTYAPGKRMLITLPGREPLCLKCHKTGHVRKTCPQNERKFTLQDAENMLRNSSPRGIGLLTYAEKLKQELRSKNFLPSQNESTPDTQPPISTPVDSDKSSTNTAQELIVVSEMEWTQVVGNKKNKKTERPSSPQKKKSKVTHLPVVYEEGDMASSPLPQNNPAMSTVKNIEPGGARS